LRQVKPGGRLIKATTGSDFHEVAHLSNFHRLRIRTITKSMNEPKNIALENI